MVHDLDPSHPGTIPRQVDREWILIQDLMGKYKDFSILIDGLDECITQHEGELDGMMEQLSTLQRFSGVRIFISSRPHAKIRAHAKGGMQITIGGDNCKNDALTFASRFLTSKPTLFQFQESIMQTISERGPNYNIQEIKMLLESASSARTNSQILERIQRFPSGLCVIYQGILDECDKRVEKDDQVIRRQIFMILFRPREHMTVRQISAAYALKPTERALNSNDLLNEAENAIQDICFPFITIIDGRVSFTHFSFKEFLAEGVRPHNIYERSLRLSDKDCDKYVAKKCLAVLLLDRYSSPRKIGMLLHRNLSETSPQTPPQDTFEDTDEFYQYAARNWAYHLTAIEDPQDDILELANEFINAFSFVHWAEFVMGRNSDYTVPFRTEYKLSRWLSTVPGNSKGLVDISRYFEKPYTTLSKHYSAEARDMELQWLCLYRLARYFILVDYRRAHPVLQQIVEGLSGLLGPENPLTLRVRTDYAILLFAERKMKEARDIFLEIWDIQREASPDSTHAYNSLAYAGLSSYYMTEFEMSKQQQQQAYEGLVKRAGANSYDALCSRLYSAYAKAGLGSEELALDEYAEVHKARSEVYGSDDGLSIMSLTARGQSERILGQLEPALESIQQAWESRLRLWDVSHANVIDTAIHLLIAYRELGLQDEAQGIVSKLDIKQIREEQYLRHCQLTHIRALLLYDEGESELAIALLQQLLDENKEGDQDNNRWLMWARLSLARIMTEHDQGDEALGLFENIIRKKRLGTGDLSESEDSPNLLKLAKDVLNLTRNRRYGEAEDRLREEDCEWVHESDLWIPSGGPAAETGLMKGPWID